MWPIMFTAALEGIYRWMEIEMGIYITLERLKANKIEWKRKKNKETQAEWNVNKWWITGRDRRVQVLGKISDTQEMRLSGK